MGWRVKNGFWWKYTPLKYVQKLIKKQVYKNSFEFDSAEPLPTLLVRDIDRNNQCRYLMNNNFLIFARKLWSGYTANS